MHFNETLAIISCVIGIVLFELGVLTITYWKLVHPFAGLLLLGFLGVALGCALFIILPQICHPSESNCAQKMKL